MRHCHSSMGAPKKSLVIIAFAALYVIWGSTYLGIRFSIETIPPFLMAGARFVFPGNRVHNHAGKNEASARHQERRNSFDREANPEVSRAPDDIQRSERDDHEASFRRGHGAMIISHSSDRANA